MVDFKKDIWLYVLIAAVLAIISIFTPVGTIEGGSFQGQDLPDFTLWWTTVIFYSKDLDPNWLGYGAASLWTLGITCMSIAGLLFYGIHNMKGMEFKWAWLFYALIGIALIVFPILMMVFDSKGIFGDVTVSFAPIGILISGCISIVAFVLDKFGDKIFGRGA
ncbi:MAG: hypothetical protein ACFFB0_20265 [Promethearchaeota archaeon]